MKIWKMAARTLLVVLAAIMALTGCGDRRAEEASREGYALYVEGRYEEAVALLDGAIEKDPDYADLYTNRAMARFESGDAAGALKDLKKSLNLKERNPEAYSGRGYVKLSQGDAEGAMADFYEAIRLQDAFEQEDGLYYTYLNLGTSLARLGSWEEALLVYDKAAAIHPDDPALMNAVGLASREAGRYREALEALGRALDLDPDYAYAYVNRAEVYRAMGEGGKALADAVTALEIDRGIPQAYRVAGQLYMDAGESSKALEILSAGIALFGSYPDLYLMRGEIYYMEERCDKAILDFSLARDLGSPEGWYGMGLCYLQMGQEEEAEESFDAYRAAGGEMPAGEAFPEP